MEQLLAALVEAVRAGSALAAPALVGYYIVRVVESVIPLIGFLVIMLTASRTIIHVVTFMFNAERLKQEEATWKAKTEACHAHFNKSAE